MALQDGINPIVLDGATQAVARKLKVSCLVWSGIATAGDDLLIHTVSGGSIIFKGTSAANVSLIIPVNGWIDGLYITTLDSGQVMVYLMD